MYNIFYFTRIFLKYIHVVNFSVTKKKLLANIVFLSPKQLNSFK